MPTFDEIRVKRITLSKEEGIELLSHLEGSPIDDLDTSTDLDILTALAFYPNNTYEELIAKGFERFENTWDSYVPELIDKGYLKKSSEDRYSLTPQGEDYYLSFHLFD